MLIHSLFRSKFILMKEKKTILIILILFMISPLIKGQTVEKSFNWRNVISAIAYVESRYDANAVSKTGNHVGYLQISRIMVKDCNRIIGYEKYTYNDRLDIKKSIEMFHLIQKTYNPSNNVEKAIRLWNGGTGYTKEKTEAYYQRVKKKLIEITDNINGQDSIQS